MITSLVLIGTTLLALIISWRADRARTIQALGGGLQSLLKLLPSMLAMIGLVGLVLALTPPDLLAGLLRHRGPVSFALITVVGAIVTMPGPVAFPLAGSLLKLGASPASLAGFITTLTMVGVVTAPMEVSYFGKRFTLLRQCLSFLLAVIIGALMGLFL